LTPPPWKDEEHDHGERDDAVDRQQHGADRIDTMRVCRTVHMGTGAGPDGVAQGSGEFRTVDKT
jgi:hypothetical protein